MKTVASFQLRDTSSNTVGIKVNTAPLVLFVFLSPECPLSQNYTRTINALQAANTGKLATYAIVPGNAYTVAEIADFARKYKLAFTILEDENNELTQLLHATVTPQAILLKNDGKLLYAGAIDNWVISLGKKRLQVTEHYLANAISEGLAGKTLFVQTKAIGCKINE